MTSRAVAVAGVVLLAVSCVFGSDATESFVLARFGKPVPVRVSSSHYDCIQPLLSGTKCGIG